MLLTDLGGLENFASMRALVLVENQISDITPLVDNPGLGEGDQVDLRGNPLSEESINVHIPALVARGVDVDY